MNKKFLKLVYFYVKIWYIVFRQENRIEVAVHQSTIGSRQAVNDRKGNHRRKLALADV